MCPVDEETSLTHPLPVSAINRFPLLSTAREVGSFSSALVAGPPSPEYPANPDPAITDMSPVDADTSRTSLFEASAMNTSPLASVAVP